MQFVQHDIIEIAIKLCKLSKQMYLNINTYSIWKQVSQQLILNPIIKFE